ncbi:MAG: PH domain-containing protein [Planctomycetota bacterium]|jgi:membrane protein YdbS with pleckstrin-like domain
MSDDARAPSEGHRAAADPPVEPPTQPADEYSGSQTGIGGDGAEVDTGAEVEVWVGRTHWKHFAGRISLWVLANAALSVLIGWVASGADWLGWRGALVVIALLLVVSAVLVLGRVLTTILGLRYRLTSQRLFLERGILSQTVDQTELIRVDDVRLQKTMLDRVFGLGSVHILSTDASDRATVIQGIADPENVAESIRKRMRTMRKKSLFIENL